MDCVLVTGGAGYIGSHTCKALTAVGIRPVVFDDFSRGHISNARFGAIFGGSILDQSSIASAILEHKPLSIIHFAAFAYVGESIEKPLAYYQNNVCGLLNVLECANRAGIKEIVFSSSCATYGIPLKVPISEDSQQIPINPYGRTKLIGEQIILDMALATRTRVAVLRYFNAAGADLDGDLPEQHEPETHLIPLAIDAATQDDCIFEIFGNDYPTVDGTCERDFVHVTDIAAAHVMALQYIRANETPLIVNIGTGRAHSVRRVLDVVERVVGRPVSVSVSPRRVGDPPVLVADPGLSRRLLGFNPRLSEIDTIVSSAWRARDRWKNGQA